MHYSQVSRFLEHLLLCEYKAHFGVDFSIEQFCCGSRDVFPMFFNVLILTQIDDFAKAIAHALWPIIPSLEHLLFFEY